MLGNEVVTLANEAKPTLINDIELNADYLSSGIYLYKLFDGEYNHTKKMILLK